MILKDVIYNGKKGISFMFNIGFYVTSHSQDFTFYLKKDNERPYILKTTKNYSSCISTINVFYIFIFDL